MREDIKARYRYRSPRGPILLRLGGLYGAALFLTILAFVSSLAAWRMYGRMARASEGEQAAQAQLARVEAQQGQVAADLQNLSTESGEEGELRRRYGVAKPGEGVIQIVVASTTSTSQTAAAAESFFGRIWHTLFP